MLRIAGPDSPEAFLIVLRASAIALDTPASAVAAAWRPTPREVAVLCRLVRGDSNREIARASNGTAIDFHGSSKIVSSFANACVRGAACVNAGAGFKCYAVCRAAGGTPGCDAGVCTAISNAPGIGLCE